MSARSIRKYVLVRTFWSSCKFSLEIERRTPLDPLRVVLSRVGGPCRVAHVCEKTMFITICTKPFSCGCGWGCLRLISRSHEIWFKEEADRADAVVPPKGAKNVLCTRLLLGNLEKTGVVCKVVWGFILKFS